MAFKNRRTAGSDPNGRRMFLRTLAAASASYSLANQGLALQHEGRSREAAEPGSSLGKRPAGMQPVAYQNLHKESIVIDGVCPLLEDKRHLQWYREGGATAVAPTIASTESASETLRALGGWLRTIRQDGRLVLVRRAADVEQAKRDGKMGIIFHLQGTDPIEDDLNLVDAYKQMGVGMIQLTYNVKNRVGDGATERTDSGLSYFGLEFVKRCNETRVIVDCSHTGYRTTMEAIEASSRPVVFSHANPKALRKSSRNITDEQIRAVAATGGLVGVVGFPGFVSESNRPTLDQFIDHIDYDVNLVGIDHVGLGIDYYMGQYPVADPEEAEALYREAVESGRWRPDTYPPPPYYYPEGLATPRELPNLTRRLLERGYSAADTRKILGENWMRVFRAVWGD